jgi:hypothetical protein
MLILIHFFRVSVPLNIKYEFSQRRSFKGTIRKFLNMLTVHIEGIRHPLYAYLTHFVMADITVHVCRKVRDDQVLDPGLNLTSLTILKGIVSRETCIN